MEKIEFEIDGARLKFFKDRDDIEVVLSTGIYQYENIKNIPSIPKGVYKVIIEPIIEEV